MGASNYYRRMTDRELATELVHALNRRDAYAPDRVPEDVYMAISAIRREQSRRRESR